MFLDEILTKIETPIDYSTWFKTAALIKDAGATFDQLKLWDQKGLKPSSDTMLHNILRRNQLVPKNKALNLLARRAGFKYQEVQKIQSFDENKNKDLCKKLFEIINIDGKICYSPSATDDFRSYPASVVYQKDFDDVNLDEIMQSNKTYYFRLNGLKDEKDYQKSISKGTKGYCIDDIACFEYAMIENDTDTIEDQIKIAGKDLPLIALIHSGNKSLHGIYHVGAKNYDEWKRRVSIIKDALKALNYHVDEATTPIQSCRFCHCRRGNNYQYIVFLDEDYLKFNVFADKYLSNKKIQDIFMTVQTNRTIKTIINRKKILEFLTYCGFIKVQNDVGNYVFYKLIGKFFQLETPQSIECFLIKAICTYIKDESKINMFLSITTWDNFISKNLPLADLRKHADKKDKTYLYFADRIIEIDKNGFRETKTIDGYIDEKSIIHQQFYYTENKGKYEQFIENISGSDDRKEAFMTAIGYLVNRHKDDSSNRLLIFTDGNTNEDGGSGKSLMLRGLKYIRHYSEIDGKSRDNNNSRFFFETLEKDANICHIQDIQKFDLSRLFNAVTGDMQIERKGQQSYLLKFEDSPKFVISCNAIPKQDNNSIMRRVVNFELTDYYVKDHDVVTELGYLFANDW